MANNRMYLRCTASECSESEPFFLAKYYPSTGWYFDAAPPAVEIKNRVELEDPGLAEKRTPNPADDAFRVQQLDDWFDEHRHWPEASFRVTYESEAP